MSAGNVEGLRLAREGMVAWLTIDRPPRNAFTHAMYEELARICASFGREVDENAPRVLIITGAGGKAFAAGTDIAQFREFTTREAVLAYEARVEAALDALERCPIPTIAAIAGACTGGGAAIAACCDLRLASADSRFGFPIARTLGNTLSIRNYQRLVNLVGPARVKEMIFTARLLSAGEAQRAGLLMEVLDDADALHARARALAEEIAGNAPLTLRAAKEALNRIRPELRREVGEDLLLSCYLSEDFQEGVEAFLAKRKPVWRGK